MNLERKPGRMQVVFNEREAFPLPWTMLRHDSVERFIHYARPWGRPVPAYIVRDFEHSRQCLIDGVPQTRLEQERGNHQCNVRFVTNALYTKKDSPYYRFLWSSFLTGVKGIAQARSIQARQQSRITMFLQIEIGWHCERFAWLKRQYEFAGERMPFLVWEGHLVPPPDLEVVSRAAKQLDLFGGTT